MPTEEDLARLEEQVRSLEESVRPFKLWAQLILEVVPTDWLLNELAERTHGGDREIPDQDPGR